MGCTGQGAADLACVAGEASGDLLASIVLAGLRQRHPGWRTAGIGGLHMQKQGFVSWWSSESLAVRGYVEVLRHYRRIVGIRRQLRERLLKNPPRVFMGVDAPDFNLDLERDLKAQGVATLHFVCPSVWAWRAERIRKLKASVDHVLCVFPFEPALLAQHGIAATYVGHPLAPHIPLLPDRSAARQLLGLASHAGPIVALLPGSRQSEIHYLAPRFLATAVRVLQTHPNARFILPTLAGLRPALEAMASASGLGSALQIVTGRSHEVLAACDVTLIASGTATLEAALYKRPMVIAYNMHWVSWQIMRRKRLQPWVGLPNILCESFVVPELLQDQATPEALATEVCAWLASPDRVTALERRFTELHHTLIRDTVGLSIEVIERFMGDTASPQGTVPCD